MVAKLAYETSLDNSGARPGASSPPINASRSLCRCAVPRIAAAAPWRVDCSGGGVGVRSQPDDQED
eukprot:5191512-Pyramimonas_sp.AAC.1